MCSNSHCRILIESLFNDANGVESSIDSSRFLKILREGDVKPTHSERERNIFSFLLDYFFADDVRYDLIKPLLPLVQNPILSMEGVVRKRKLNFY